MEVWRKARALLGSRLEGHLARALLARGTDVQALPWEERKRSEGLLLSACWRNPSPVPVVR
jgi:hypothetical protein